MNKVGIITFHWSNNFGAILQALSLRSYMKNNFKLDVEFEKFMPYSIIKRERMSLIRNKNIQLFYFKLKKNFISYYWKRRVANLEPPDQNIVKFDKSLYVYGSDEIWNYSGRIFEYNPYYFGQNNPKPKISYATSIGSVSNYKFKYVDEIKRNLKKFVAISVRDKNSYDFIEYCTKIKPTIVLDPCLLINIKFLDIANNKYNSYKTISFILVYGTYFSPQEIKEIINIKNNNRCVLVSVGYYNSWCDKNILELTPVDFVFFIKNSKIVFTSMFHGVIFSFKYKKNFWYSKDPYRKNKLSFFLEYFNLEKRSIDNLSKKEIDYKIIQSKYKEIKDISEEFLKKNILKNI
jgi:hypothetical protein